MTQPQRQLSQHPKQHPQHFALSSCTSASISKSNTKFIIRYEEKQLTTSGHKINRYSSKHEHELIRSKKISESVLQKTKLRNKDGYLPSYLKPTQASISAQLDRNRVASVADMNNQNKIGLVKMRSKSLEEEDQQSQREYNRVPIEFYDEKNYGCGADSLRARVVFRGYAPKNTYYYLKTLKPYKRKPRKPNQAHPSSSLSIPQQQKLQPPTIQQASSSSTIKNENDIKFDSKFESGNLSAAARISASQYWLYMRQDTNTHGLRQWYYFTVANKKMCKIKFRIYGFTKSYSLYKMGMKPYIRHSMMADFHQGGEKVKYQYDNLQKGYFLGFQFKFEEDFMEVQFAMLPPYTYSTMKQFLRGLQTPQPNPFKQNSPQINPTPIQHSPTKDPNIRIQTTIIGQSLSGLNINLLKIKKQRNKYEYEYEYKYEQKQRQCIIILSRTHPGETVSNYTLQSFIYTVLNDSSVIEYYDFFIIPMVNPDGVYFGNHRTSIIGQDLNRNYHTQDFDVFPQIQAVNNVINTAKKTHKIRYLLDLHGHSARKNIFAYGPQHQINTPQYLHSRILPKLLNDALSSFKYDYCVFRQSKQKKNTARVHFTNKYKINCLTFQQSYGIVDNQVIGVQHWRNFGIALANSLLELAQMYKHGKEKALQAYLAQEMEKEKLILQKRYEKHRKMLGLTQFIPMVQQKDVELDRKNKTQTAIKLVTQNKKKSELTQSLKNDQEQNHQSLNHQQSIQHEQSIIEQRKKQEKQCIEKQQQQQQQQLDGQQQQQSQDTSVNSSMLSSGDESLELHNDQIQQIKKQIIKIGCLKQGLKRQKYNIADKKLQLFDVRPNPDIDTNKDPHTYRQNISTYRRLHEQKSSMIPRIAKLQQKRKDDYNLSFKRQFREDRRDIIEKERLERKKEIQAKFRRMELPSIKK